MCTTNLQIPTVICCIHLLTLPTSKTPSRSLNFSDVDVFVVMTPIFPAYQRKSLAKTNSEFQPGLSWNSRQIPGGLRRNSTGIHWNSSRNSAGIVAGIPPVLHWNSSRNAAGIIAGIPPVFHWNSSRNAAGMIAGILPEFCWNYCRHTTGILNNSSWNSWPDQYHWNDYYQHFAGILDFSTQH